MLCTQASPRSYLFVSAKTSTAIPARHALVRDALVEATLDPQVRALEFVPSAIVEAARVALQTIMLVRDDGRFYLEVVDARPVGKFEVKNLALIALDQLRFGPLTLTAPHIKREPRFAQRKRRLGVPAASSRHQNAHANPDGPLQLGCLLPRVRAVRIRRRR
jgi:hypothetical protein